MFERAGELGLVDVAVGRELAGGFDRRLGLAVEERLVRLLLATDREGDRLQQEEDVVLAALAGDLLDERQVMLGRDPLGRLERREELDGIGADELDLLD